MEIIINNPFDAQAKAVKAKPTKKKNTVVSVKALVGQTFAFTWFYPEGVDPKAFFDADLQKENCRLRYVFGGMEICPETKRQHVNGYLKTKQKTTNYVLKELYGFGYCAPLLKPELANKRYCSKDGLTFECGVNPSKGKGSTNGKRSDLEGLRERVQSGHSYRDIMKDLTTAGALQCVDKYFKYYEPPRTYSDQFRFIWVYGATELGKTRHILNNMFKAEYEKGDVYVTLSTSQWWDGYDRHPVILVDDFRSSFCPFKELLNICQPIEHKVQVKGTTRQLVCNTVIITSCHSPLECYKNVTEDRNQLYRRITQVLHFTGDGEFVDESEQMRAIVSRLKAREAPKQAGRSLMDQFNEMDKCQSDLNDRERAFVARVDKVVERDPQNAKKLFNLLTDDGLSILTSRVKRTIYADRE